MDLLPGTINLILVETDKDGSKAKKVKKFILNNNLKEKYDFIFIDCPPTISVYTDAALIASDFYLVPIRIDRYSILGIKLLKQVIDRLDDNESIGIKPLGIVYTMVKELSQKTVQFSVIRENYRPERKDWKLDLRVNEHTELEIFAEENPPKRVNRPEACGLRHLAFCVESVEQTVKELRELGIECEPIRDDDYTGKKMTFFHDPDGLPLELHE